MTYKDLEDYYDARDDDIRFDLERNCIQYCLNDFRNYIAFKCIFDAGCKHGKD